MVGVVGVANRLVSVLCVLCLHFNMEMQWNIVEFLDSEGNETPEKEISVVPQKWIFKKHDQNRCFWPNNNNKIRKLIKHATDYDDNWESWPVKIMLIEPGRRRTESETCLSNRSGRKRKPTKHSSFISEEFEEIIEPLPKIYKNNQDAIVVEHSAGSASTISLNSTDLMPPPEQNFFPDNFRASTPLNNTPNTHEQNEIAAVNIENAEILYEFENNNITTVDNTTDIQLKLDQVLRTTQSNKILLERLLRHFDNGAYQNNVHQEDIQETVLKTSFNKMKDLLSFNSTVEESVTVQKQLETIFFISGGSSINDNIRRGLKKIFSDKLARKCSWLGRKNNYQISNLKIITILKTAVRKNFPNLSDQHFETVVANWLRQANLRYTRQKRRNSLQNQ